MRSARTSLLSTVATGVVVIVVLALVKGTTLAFTLGVPVAGPVVTLAPGFVVCQEGIEGPDDVLFDEIDVTLGTFEEAGPPVRATVRGPGGEDVATGVLEGGFPDITEVEGQTIGLGEEVRFSPGMDVCFRNEGTRNVALYGAPDVAAQPTTAVLQPITQSGDDEDRAEEDEDEQRARDALALRSPRPVGADIAIELRRSERSYLSLVGDIGERMRLFRGPLLPAWLYLGGLLVLLAGVTAALSVAIRSTERDPAGDGADPRGGGGDDGGPGPHPTGDRTQDVTPDGTS